MPKEGSIEFQGVVLELLPNAMFKVKLEKWSWNSSSLIRKNEKKWIRVLAGDKVTVEMTPYDLTKGRITFSMEIKKSKKNNIISLKKKSKCPTCKKVSKEPFIPFCSKKCASLDLMKWLTDEHGLQIKSD